MTGGLERGDTMSALVIAAVLETAVIGLTVLLAYSDPLLAFAAFVVANVGIVGGAVAGTISQLPMNEQEAERRTVRGIW